MINPFFKNTGPYDINELLNLIDLESEKYPDKKINDIKDLSSSSDGDISFFHSKKYLNLAKNTKASYCITTESLKKNLPNACKAIISDKVLLHTAKITKIFYPDSVEDEFDSSAKDLSKTSLKKKVKYGKNVLIGKNVKIGKNCFIGHNSIIEKNVIIGSNCKIGSNVIIRNTVIKDNVSVLDGCVIGKKGFGFFPNKKNNTRYPHIGIVIINDGCEIGCNSTIDRGSLGDTIINDFVMVDNLDHIAHNVKIGKGSIICGQSGIAGSTNIGDNVVIAAQVGISGHLNIKSNTILSARSGVTKDIKNAKLMGGFPAIPINEFRKQQATLRIMTKKLKK